MSEEQSFCISCGHGLRPGCAFCEKCGAAAPSAKRVDDSPILPPKARRDTSQTQAGQPARSSGGSWLLPAVGVALVVVLMGVGLKLLGSSPGPKTASLEPQAGGNPSTRTETPSEQPEPRSTSLESTTPTPEVTPSLGADPVDEEIPGIERIPLDRAESYLPYPRSRYRHSMKYPDGDHGFREMVVTYSDNQVLTTLEFTHSALYPDDPPGLWVNHYVSRADGIYLYSDDDPYRAELWLPNDLTPGKKWKSAMGDFEIVAFDQDVTVNGTPYKGVLAYRQRSSEVGVDQTVWLAPGHGELKGCYGEAGEEFFRLLHVESEPESEIDALMKRHVRNLDKIK